MKSMYILGNYKRLPRTLEKSKWIQRESVTVIKDYRKYEICEKVESAIILYANTNSASDIRGVRYKCNLHFSI